MYCVHCGKEIPDGSEFCSYCGKPQIISKIKEFSDAEPKYTSKSKKTHNYLRRFWWIVISAIIVCVMLIVFIGIKNNHKKDELENENAISFDESTTSVVEKSDESIGQVTLKQKPLQTTNVPYDFEAPEIDDEDAFELNTPGNDNGEYVDVKAIFDQYPDMGGAFYPVDPDDNNKYTGCGRNFHGFTVEISSIKDSNNGAVVIRGLNSNKTLSVVPITVFDSNAICSFGEGNRDKGEGYYTDFGYTYVKSIENLKRVLEILNETDNYDDEDACPLEHMLMYHVHPSTKNRTVATSKQDDFSPYDDFFDIEDYFYSWQTKGSISYSASSDGYDTYGLKAGQHYCANFNFNGWKLEIMYTDQESLWGYDSGRIVLRNGNTSDVIASFEQPPENERRKVVIDKDGNTTYEGTLVLLTQIMPVLVNEQESGYCPLDAIGIEHNH